MSFSLCPFMPRMVKKKLYVLLFMSYMPYMVKKNFMFFSLCSSLYVLYASYG